MGDHLLATTILFDVGVVIVAATLLGLAARFLRQPLLAGYILAGIIIGPSMLGLVENSAVIETFAELGVAFLLFIVGLELDISRLGEVRNVVISTAVAEILLLFGLGFWIMFFLGFDSLSALYIGLFIAFNSTAVLVKLLSDRGDIDTLHGRIILGVLLIQDITVILALSVLSSLHNPTAGFVLSALLTGAGMLALAVVFSKYLVGSFFSMIEQTHELVFLSSLTVLFAFIGIGFVSGLSSAVGGFLAGIALASFPYNIEIAERARTLRDFFVTIFFVSLGMLVDPVHLLQHLPVLAVLLGLVLVFKPVLVNLVVSLSRYGKRASFFTGISLSQVSEFSMVIALTGLTMGHIGQEVFSLMTAVMVITISVTPYILNHQRQLFELFEDMIIEFRGARYEEETTEVQNHVVICGGHIKGGRILKLLLARGETVVVIDYDPDVIRSVEETDAIPIYGDVEDAQVLDRANVSEAKTVISTVPDEHDNRYLLEYVERYNNDAVTILSSNTIESALLLYEEGADYVLYPAMLAAQEAADMVEQLYEDGVVLDSLRQHHIQEMEHTIEEQILKRYEPAFIKRLKDRMQKVRPRDRDR